MIGNPDILMVMGTYSENSQELNFVSDYKNLDLGFRFAQLQEKIPYVSSFVFAIHKETLKKYGGFSTDFKKSSVEDVEFGWRVCNGKNATLQDRNIKVEHKKEYSLLGLIRSNFIRVINLYKIRVNSKNKYPAGNDIPVSYKINLILAPLTALMTFTGLFNKQFLLLTSCSLIIFTINNLKFLMFILKKRGLFFSLKCIGIMIIEYVGVAGAMFFAIATTPFNKRYY